MSMQAEMDWIPIAEPLIKVYLLKADESLFSQRQAETSASIRNKDIPIPLVKS